MNILFVCTANVSRSFLAEKLLRKELQTLHQEGNTVSSAGLHAFPGSPPDPAIVAYLEEMGIPVEGHTARQIEKEDVEWADLIVVMERLHADRLEKTWPEAKQKTKLLGSYIPGVVGEDDVVDPYGRSVYHYRLAQSQITTAVKALARSLIRNRLSPGGRGKT